MPHLAIQERLVEPSPSSPHLNAKYSPCSGCSFLRKHTSVAALFVSTRRAELNGLTDDFGADSLIRTVSLVCAWETDSAASEI